MGFCLFGVIGNCKQESTNRSMVERQINISKEIIDTKFQSINNEMKFNTVQLNRIVCRSAGFCRISGVTIEQVAQLTAEGRAKLSLSVKNTTVINELVDAAAKIALETINKNTGSSRRDLTEAEMKTVISTKTQLISNTSQTIFSACVASILQSNIIEAEAKDGAIIETINIKQSATLMANCVIDMFIDEMKKVKIDQEIKDQLEIESKMRSQGLLDFDTTTLLIVGGAAIALILLVILIKGRGESKETVVYKEKEEMPIPKKE